MEQNKAIQILIEAVSLAQQKGAYSLEQIDAILPAVKTCLPKPEVKEEVKEVVEEVKE